MQHYHSMASEPIGDLMVDAELKHYCAYSFPAVLATIGAARWPEVRTLFHTLVQVSLRFKGLFLYTVGILRHVEWCIR